jgi:hypothetical protein
MNIIAFLCSTVLKRIPEPQYLQILNKNMNRTSNPILFVTCAEYNSLNYYYKPSINNAGLRKYNTKKVRVSDNK